MFLEVFSGPGISSVPSVLLTICGLQSAQRLAVLVPVHSNHRHPVEGLRSQGLKLQPGHVTWNRGLTALASELRLPADPVALHIARCRGPGGNKAGVRDITGDQLGRRASFCKTRGSPSLVDKYSKELRSFLVLLAN